MLDEPIKVLYIVGSQRSGSTLLDRMLGQVEGLVSCGELYYIWHRGFSENQLCGCGERFRRCDFWCTVCANLGKRLGNCLDAAEMDRLNEHYVHHRYVPLMAVPRALQHRLRAGRDIWRYQEALAELYACIRTVSGASVIVDSSKSYVFAFLLAGIPKIELHAVHLVRDSRAVVFSNTRKRRRPEVVERMAYMSTLPAWDTCVGWNTVNLLAPSLRRRRASSYQLVRYHDLVSSPKAVLRGILSRLHVGSERMSLDFVRDGEVMLQPNHTVAGNPMRFSQGAVLLQLDDEWRQRMSPRLRRVVTIFTLPLLLRYGFV